MKKQLLWILIALGGILAPLDAGISAYAYIDYYMLNHHDAKLDGQHGLWLRRAYFTYDRDISDKFKARLRFEVNNEGKLKTSANIVPYVKDAYLSYQYLTLHSMTLGIQESLAFGNTEKFWGYRHIEKTFLDLFKVRGSRDFGFTLKGSVDQGKKYSYALMVGNNSGYREELDKNKAVYARVTALPIPEIMLELYYDSISISSVKDSTLLQVFAGFQKSWGRIGLNYAYETIREDGKSDVKTGLFSGLAAFTLSSKLEVFGRYDMVLDPAPWAQDSYMLMTKAYKTNLFIAGLGWNIHPKIQIAPNVKIQTYGNDVNGAKGPGSDTYYSVTFYFQF